MRHVRISLTDAEGESEYVFTQFPVVIGRHPNCGLQLRDIGASRHHATVSFDGEAFIIHDTGSTKGTVVLAGSLSCELRNEALRVPGGRVALRLGSTALRITADSGDTHTLPKETIDAAARHSSRLREARAMATTSPGNGDPAEQVLDAMFQSLRELHTSLATEIPGVTTSAREGSLTSAQTSMLAVTYELWRSLSFVAQSTGRTIPAADVPPGDALAPVRLPSGRGSLLSSRAPQRRPGIPRGGLTLLPPRETTGAEPTSSSRELLSDDTPS